MVRSDVLTPALEFLEILEQKWTGIIKATVRASVEELAYMNRIRFSMSSQNSVFDSDDPNFSSSSLEKRNCQPLHMRICHPLIMGWTWNRQEIDRGHAWTPPHTQLALIPKGKKAGILRRG